LEGSQHGHDHGKNIIPDADFTLSANKTHHCRQEPEPMNHAVDAN